MLSSVKGQAVFKVNMGPTSPEPVYHARRSHRKSRLGCLTCKRRRLKCDEARPVCNRCHKIGLECAYSDSTNGDSNPNALISSLSLTSMKNQINGVLQTDPSFISQYLTESKTSTSIPVLAFEYFVNSSTKTVANPAIRQVMMKEMIQISFANPHLLHTVIAAGLVHINRLSPPTKTRRFAEAYFWQQAISLYQKALCTGVTLQNVDALLSTCMLMSINTLVPEKFEVSDSWVLSPRPGAMNWICLQSGLKCIITAAAPYLKSTIWFDAFMESRKHEDPLFDDRPGAEGLEPTMADLCDINDDSTAENNPYHHPLRMLSAILNLEKNATNSSVFTTFIGRLENDYLGLLRERDERALIILAYWMGVMCSVAQWQPWVEGRIRKECTAICMYLECSTDPRILGLLEYPAFACGYTLKNGLLSQI